jgi:hypothetical protein
VPAHEAESLTEVGHRRARLLAAAVDAEDSRHERDRERRQDKRACVECKRCARAERGDGQTSDRGPGQGHHERADELVERVRLHEHSLRDDLRHGRVERRAEEGVPRSEDDREQEEMPELEHSCEREHRDDGYRERANEVGRDHDPPAVDAVAHHAADEQERRHRQGPCDADQREGGRRVGDLIDLPCDRHDVDAVAEKRHGRAGPEQRKVPDRQGAQDLHMAQAYRRFRVHVSHSSGLDTSRRQAGPERRAEVRS